MIFIEWDEYLKDVKSLCDKIREEYDLSKCIAVQGVPRGGLVPAVIISHELGIPFDSHRYIPQTSPDEWVLVIDDIYDLGNTYMDYKLNDHSIVFACVYRKSNLVDKTPDLYYKDLDPTKWIVFPYENTEKAKIDCKEYYSKREKNER